MSEDGTTVCAIGERDGNVILDFPKSVKWAAFDPETARRIGEAMAREAYKIHTGRDFTEKKSILSEQKRDTLVNRIMLIIADLQRKKKKPDYVAKQVVDTLLAEIL